MRNIFSIIIALICFTGIQSLAQAQAQAAKPVKMIKAGKERLVLMPLRVSEEDKNLQGALETALVEGLQQSYEVLSGEQVALKAREIFLKESRITTKKYCDETRCMQGIAEAFQAELIATATVTKQDGGYFLALNIQNIFDNRVIYAKSVPCDNCNIFQAVDKFKSLSGMSVQVLPPIYTLEANPGVIKGDPDAALWNEAQNGNTVEYYQVYLENFPKGKYMPFAKARIKILGDKAQASAEQQHRQAWDIAQQENSEASYGVYLMTFPKGRFASLANARIKKIKSDETARISSLSAAKEEAELWNKANSSNDQIAIATYISRYPGGRFIEASTAKLKLLKEEETKVLEKLLGMTKEEEKVFENMSKMMVRIPGKKYEIGKFEVTQVEWRTVMGSNQSKFPNCGDNCPVDYVSWAYIQTFIQKINEKTGRQYRLPTEDEWQFACNGGIQSEYCGGNDINALAWIEANSNMQPHPVGQKLANGYGLHDMSGNVWEWLNDCYDDNCTRHYLRGGSWNDSAQYARTTSRFSEYTRGGLKSGGFRLARTIP